MKNNGRLIGVGITRKGYLQSEKGYYTQGFSTLIKKATEKDISLAEKYALDLVSDFEEIKEILLSLHKRDEDTSLTSVTTTYEVRTGKLICGLMIITISRLLTRNMISFNYLKRISPLEFYRSHNMLKSYDKTKSVKAMRRKKEYNSQRNKKYRK